MNKKYNRTNAYDNLFSQLAVYLENINLPEESNLLSVNLVLNYEDTIIHFDSTKED